MWIKTKAVSRFFSNWFSSFLYLFYQSKAAKRAGNVKIGLFIAGVDPAYPVLFWFGTLSVIEVSAKEPRF
jgi:hypothetical protein